MLVIIFHLQTPKSLIVIPKRHGEHPNHLIWGSIHPPGDNEGQCRADNAGQINCIAILIKVCLLTLCLCYGKDGIDYHCLFTWSQHH